MKTALTTILLLSMFIVANAQYFTFGSNHNEISQTVLRTSDSSYLVASLQFCYTPEEWMIEGCPVGVHLLRTNLSGDTIWETEIVNYDVQGPLHVFENRDGSFSLFTAQDATLRCHEWIIKPPIGLMQVLTYHISADGELISQSSFPEDCNLQLIEVHQLLDTSYAVLAKYNEPFASDTIEGRLYILNQKGIVIRSHVLPDEPMNKADIMIDSLQKIMLFFVDKDSIARLQVFDKDLSLEKSYFNDEVNSDCLLAGDTRGFALLTDSGQVVVMCDNPFGKGDNLELLVFDSIFRLQDKINHTLPLAADFTINEDQEIIILSQHYTEEDSSDIKLSYFTLSGDSLLTRHFRIPGNQAPGKIVAFEEEDFAITGAHNCCNLSAADGPGKTFLYLAQLSTSNNDRIDNATQVMITPNPADDRIQISLGEIRSGASVMNLSIFSQTGGKVFEKKINSTSTIQIEFLPQGFYLVYLQDEDGRSGYGSFIKIKP